MGLGIAAAHGDDSVGVVLPGAEDDLPGLLVADGGDGAGVDDIGVGLLLKGHENVAPGSEHLLQCLSFVLIDLAAEGIKSNFHSRKSLKSR